jgi:voltage-gated potassium channel Kch
MWGRSGAPPPPLPPPPPPPDGDGAADAGERPTRASLAARSAALATAARDPHAHEREERDAALRLEDLEDVGEDEEEEDEGSGAALYADAREEDGGPSAAGGDIEQGVGGVGSSSSRSRLATASTEGLLMSPPGTAGATAAATTTPARSSSRSAARLRQRHFARYQRQMMPSGGEQQPGADQPAASSPAGLPPSSPPPPPVDDNDPAVEEAFRAALKRHHASDAHEAVLARVQFRRLAAAWLRDSGWGRRLMVFDCLLSVSSVVLYIASTYAVPVGKSSPAEAASGAAEMSTDPVARGFLFADLGLAIFFALHWLLRLWISEERLPFMFTFGSLIDLLTTVPTFVAVALTTIAPRADGTVPAFAFLRVFRVLRVVRIFTITRADSPSALASEVSRAAALLGFTFVTFIVLAATLFYEIERRDPESENKDISFGEALYWGCVTLTTVGYGDISPNTAMTQALTVVMLGAFGFFWSLRRRPLSPAPAAVRSSSSHASFSLPAAKQQQQPTTGVSFVTLPFLTTKLLDALAATSVYQRAWYKGPGCFGAAPHVVVTGCLDGDSVGNFTSELYHSDKGFAEVRTVFLSPQPPSLAVKQALAAASDTGKLFYLQGTPFRPVDLSRAAVATANAIFVIVDRAAPDPAAADRRAVMTLLAIGTHLQEAAVASADAWRRTAWRRRWLLACVPRCLRPAAVRGGAAFGTGGEGFFSATPPRTHVPEIFVQLLLPESRHMLNRVLRGLHDRSRLGALAAADLHEAAAAAAARRQHRWRRRRRTAGDFLHRRPGAGNVDGNAAAGNVDDANDAADDNDDLGALTPTPNMPAPPPAPERAAAVLRALRDLGQRHGPGGSSSGSSSDASSSDDDDDSSDFGSDGADDDRDGSGRSGGLRNSSLSSRSRFAREQARRERRRAAKRQQRLLYAEYAREQQQQGQSNAAGGISFVAAGDETPPQIPHLSQLAARRLRAAQVNTAAYLKSGPVHEHASRAAAANYGFGDDAVGTLLGANFWAAMSAGLRIIVFGELRNALLSHSLLCPGAITLLCNAATTAGEAPTREARPDLPGWLVDYARGAGHELYEAGVFPRALHGCTYEEAAGFVFDHCGAVLLALDRISGAEPPGAAAEAVGEEVVEGVRGGGGGGGAGGGVGASPPGGSVARSGSIEGAAPREAVSFLQIAPFGSVIDAGTCGYMLALDVKAVAAVVEARERDVKEWRLRRERERAAAAVAAAGGVSSGSGELSGGGGEAGGGGGPLRAVGRSGSLIDRQRAAATLAAARAGMHTGGSGRGGAASLSAPAAPHHHHPHHRPHRPISGGGGQGRRRLQRRPPAAAHSTHEALIPATLLRSASRDARLAARAYMARHYRLRHEGGGGGGGEALGDAPPPLPPPAPSPLPQQPQPRRSLFSRAPQGWSLGGAGSEGAADDAAGGQGGGDYAPAAAPGGPFAPPAPEAAERAEDAEQAAARLDAARDTMLINRMVLDRVPFSGHVLIVGTPASLGSLLNLIAPLRSRVLTRPRPIVVLSHERPRPDTLWADIARFQDVYVICLNSCEGAGERDGGGGGGMAGSGRNADGRATTAGGAAGDDWGGRGDGAGMTAGGAHGAAGVFGHQMGGGGAAAAAGGSATGGMAAGNVVSADDLLRANAEGATHALLLTGAGAGSETAAAVAASAAASVAAGADEEEALLEAHMLYDSSVLGAYQALRALNPAMRIITELVWAGYAAFLRPVHPVAGLPAGLRPEELAPAYLSGTVLMPRSLDALMVMAFTNRRSDALLQRLLSAWHAGGGGREAAKLVQRLRRWRALKAAHALAAATAEVEAEAGGGGGGGDSDPAMLWDEQQQQQGRSATASRQPPAADTLLQRTGSARFAPDVAAAAVGASAPSAAAASGSSRRRGGGGDGRGGGGSSSRGTGAPSRPTGECPTLVQVALSPQLEGCSYRDYFQHMVADRRMLPLGLFRAVSQGGQRFSCAITNPPPATPVLAADRAFVVFDVSGSRERLPEDVLWF